MGNACGAGGYQKGASCFVIVVVAVVLALHGRRRTEALHPQVRSAGMGKNLVDGRDGMELC